MSVGIHDGKGSILQRCSPFRLHLCGQRQDLPLPQT